MTDKEKLNRALSEIVTESSTCRKCAFRHYYSDSNTTAFCLVAMDCICHSHKNYRKESEK